MFEKNGNIFVPFQISGMASIEEVWGKPFPKKSYNMLDNKRNDAHVKRDAEQEGRVFPTPIHRTQAAVQRHKKTIDDLSTNLPIITSDEEADNNFAPAKIQAKEHMTNWSSTKSQYTNPYQPQDPGLDFAYAPPSFQQEAYDMKLDRIMRMIEQNRTGYETPGSQDMMLYIFTGVFFLFTLDTFVNLGKRMK